MNQKKTIQELRFLVKEIKQMIRENPNEPAPFNQLGDTYLALYKITADKIYLGAAEITFEESFKIDGNSIAQDGLQKVEQERLRCVNKRPKPGKKVSSSQMKTSRKQKLHDVPRLSPRYYEDWDESCWISEWDEDMMLLIDEMSSDETYNYYFGDDDWADIHPQGNWY